MALSSIGRAEAWGLHTEHHKCPPPVVLTAPVEGLHSPIWLICGDTGARGCFNFYEYFHTELIKINASARHKVRRPVVRNCEQQRNSDETGCIHTWLFSKNNRLPVLTLFILLSKRSPYVSYSRGKQKKETLVKHYFPVSKTCAACQMLYFSWTAKCKALKYLWSLCRERYMRRILKKKIKNKSLFKSADV